MKVESSKCGAGPFAWIIVQYGLTSQSQACHMYWSCRTGMCVGPASVSYKT